jgi:hypothetical protein
LTKGFMGKSGKSLLALSSFMLMGFLVFSPALRIGFLGDFAGDLYGSQNDWLNFAAYQWNFYVPAMAIYSGLYKTFHLSPAPYHIFHLSVIFINAWLVYLLARELKFESWQCWIAGLLALFNSSAFEAYFWLSTIPKALATTSGLAALIFLSRFRQTRASIWGWGYLIMVTVGMSLESTGLILPLLGLCLDIYYRPWRVAREDKVTLLSGLRLHFWSFSLGAIFLLIRQVLGIRPYVVSFPMTQKFVTLAVTIYNTFFHGLPEGFRCAVQDITLISVILTSALLIILGSAWHFKRGPDRRRFVTLLLLWVGACLPHTIGANIQSRYFYFPGVFAALVLGDLLGTLRLRLHAWKSAWLFVSLVIIGYLSTDYYAFHQPLSYYMEATHIYDAGIQKIKSKLPEVPAGTRLVLIDFPGSIKRSRTSHQGHKGGYRILIYRNALPFHLNMLYNNSNITVTLLKTSHPNDNDDNPDPLGTPSSPEKLAELLASPQTVAWRYLPGNPEYFVLAGNPKP